MGKGKGKDKIPVTPGIRALRAAKIEFTPCLYQYEDHGGTGVAARELGVEEHQVVKTLVMQDQDKNPLIILMHGDQEVSTKALARQLKLKTVTPCDPAAALKHTGYQVGGISPFGTKKKLPVYVEAGILDLEWIYLNAGKRGLLVKISIEDLQKVVEVVAVEVAL